MGIRNLNKFTEAILDYSKSSELDQNLSPMSYGSIGYCFLELDDNSSVEKI